MAGIEQSIHQIKWYLNSTDKPPMRVVITHQAPQTPGSNAAKIKHPEFVRKGTYIHPPS